MFDTIGDTSSNKVCAFSENIFNSWGRNLKSQILPTQEEGGGCCHCSKKIAHLESLMGVMVSELFLRLEWGGSRVRELREGSEKEEEAQRAKGRASSGYTGGKARRPVCQIWKERIRLKMWVELRRGNLRVLMQGVLKATLYNLEPLVNLLIGQGQSWKAGGSRAGWTGQQGRFEDCVIFRWEVEGLCCGEGGETKRKRGRRPLE